MRILIITNWLPYPPISGTPLRTYNLLLRVAREHQVWLASYVKGPEQAEGVRRLQEFCSGVETVSARQLGAFSRPMDFFRYILRGKPPDLRLYHSEELTHKIQRLDCRVNFDVVEIVNSYMSMFVEALPRDRRTRTILTFIDVVFSQYARMSRLESKLNRKGRLWLHSRMMRRWEPYYAERFDRCVTVSETDRRLLLAANPRLQVEVVPNGVDVQMYQQLPDEDTKPPSLVFVGNMDYRPNIDAMLYFCKDVLPRIRRVKAEVEMWIVGINARSEVRQLDGNGVHVTGRVDDVRPYYRQSTACVVPLRAGGGTRLKILEAMALGRPVVSTSIGCEGLDVVDGKHLFIADTPGQFAEKTVRLLTDKALRRRIARNARRLVVTHYDWDAIAKRLLHIYAELT